jgi:hypothetical protein
MDNEAAKSNYCHVKATRYHGLYNDLLPTFRRLSTFHLQGKRRYAGRQLQHVREDSWSGPETHVS